MEKNEPDRRLPMWFRRFSAPAARVLALPARTSGATQAPRSRWAGAGGRRLRDGSTDSRVLIVGVLVVASVAAGCDASSGSAREELAADEVAARYGYDVSTATLSPVYALVPQYRDPMDGYARDLLAEQCLQGVVTYRAVPPGSGATLIDERTGQLVFDEEIAQQWGYPQFRLPSTSDGAVGDGVEITPAMHDTMVLCGQQTDERLGQVPERPFAAIESAGWEAVATAAEVQQAVGAWRTCMAPAGVVDLPAEPNEMPPASIMSLTPDPQGNETDVGEAVLSDREREVAVLDARCRAEVGYDDAVLRARADAELAAIGRDVEGFEAGRRAYEEYGKKIDEVITELG